MVKLLEGCSQITGGYVPPSSSGFGTRKLNKRYIIVKAKLNNSKQTDC